MSQDCPLCFNKEVFPSWCALKDSLVYLCSRNFTCPICSEVHEGLERTKHDNNLDGGPVTFKGYKGLERTKQD